MLSFLNPYRLLTTTSLLLRMVAAFLCGSVIGIEREYKRRPAGFRTHILICMGAAMTTLTGQYLAIYTSYPLDVARMGAQVIAGIGFIGAGTILVTKRQRVKGLTTAAGLWVSAIVGLAIGLGFYEAGFLATGLVLLAEIPFSILEYHIASRMPEVSLYIGCGKLESLHSAEGYLQRMGVRILNTEIVRSHAENAHAFSVILLLRVKRNLRLDDIIHTLRSIQGIAEVSDL